jgi:hypothetical protein
MTQSQDQGIRYLNTSINELLFHIAFADTGFHFVPESDVGKVAGERYERSFQVELDDTSTRIAVTGLLSEQQSRYVATIHFSDEGQCTNPSTELMGAMSDGLLDELSGSIYRKLESKQRLQSTQAPPR